MRNKLEEIKKEIKEEAVECIYTLHNIYCGGFSYSTIDVMRKDLNEKMEVIKKDKEWLTTLEEILEL